MNFEELKARELVNTIDAAIEQRQLEIEKLYETRQHIFRNGIPEDFNFQTLNLDKN